jgi:hypothetical protein
MAKKTATKEVTKSKAAISAKQLADFMGVEQNKVQGLAAYCTAAQQVCNAFAESELKESHVATMALLHCAVWLEQSKAKTVKELSKLPLTVRYMVITAAEADKA